MDRTRGDSETVAPPTSPGSPPFTKGLLDDATAQRFAALEIIGHNSSDFIVVLNRVGQVLYGNPVAQRMFGLTPEQGVGVDALQFIHPDDLDNVVARYVDLMTTPGASIRDTIRTVTSDGEVRELEIVSTNSLDNPLVGGIVVNGQDVTDRNDYVDRLQVLAERFRVAFEENMAPMTFTDLEDRITDVNDAMCRMIGYSKDELIGQDSRLFTFPEDVGITEESHRRAIKGDKGKTRYIKRYVRKDGQVIVVEVSRSPALDAEGNPLYFVFSERDITEERALTAELSNRALHDPLTGLANRTLFEDRLAHAHAKVVRRGGFGAVLLLDLDDFKGVNDTYGHVVGDQLLAAIGQRLKHITRNSDTLCRFGGDEFLYLAEEMATVEEVEVIARRMLDALTSPFTLADAHFVQRASIGVVAWDASGPDVTELVQSADVALYEAKRQGRSRFVVFTPDMHRQAVSRFTLVQELSHAIQNDELSMHYQPIIDLQSNDIVGFEALMRWRHPERGPVPPDVFIPLAEQSNLILDLGAFALREAVAAAKSWEDAGSSRAPYVTVNLSVRQFHDPDLITTVRAELEKHDLDPERLILEITESVALEDVADSLRVMKELTGLGVGIALDDFGTGFSSLSYLVQLNPKVIKIDQSFVRPASVGPESDAILELIILLGRKLGVVMLAEGVETAPQLERLKGYECRYGQGYLWSPAVPYDEVPSVLDALRGDPPSSRAS